MSQVVTLYKDKEKTDALYPRTKVSAISDENNTSLQELLNRYEIIDNLTSYDTDKALSANQGRELKALVDTKADKTDVNNLQTVVNGKANSSHTHTKSEITDFAHTHDDRYYTESEIDTKVSELNTAIANSGKFYGIDFNNVIASCNSVGTDGWATTTCPTPTQDCYAVCLLKAWALNYPITLTIDGKSLTYSHDGSGQNDLKIIPLKSGQTFSFNLYQRGTSTVTYYGLKG